MRHIHVHLLPDLVEENALTGATVVVMDVLRATTTLTCALAAGASGVIVCREVNEARQIADSLKLEAPDAQRPLLGGEREGIRIAGFDLGNSPAEYTREAVGGRTLVFTTTNGTRACLRCRQARRVLLGALVNRRAVLQALVGENQIHLMCAGTRGEITREDALCAGARGGRSHRAEGDDLAAQRPSAARARRMADSGGRRDRRGKARCSAQGNAGRPQSAGRGPRGRYPLGSST